ncbi:hypothetical protein J2045_002381 [Peteryoungia aggregata LMG 23059]|uniref:DUF4169 family protein n=2 Tax=Peteryoungia aggregata TaxID=34013 RepID=A0ABU0G9M8_9HYPH|nr:hypothetical protein [Peteryoungia aggregata LMG 23059]
MTNRPDLAPAYFIEEPTMAADVVNLRQFRKAKARSEREATAEQNRISHGRTKIEKSLTRAENEMAARLHEQGRIEKPEQD